MSRPHKVSATRKASVPMVLGTLAMLMGLAACGRKSMPKDEPAAAAAHKTAPAADQETAMASETPIPVPSRDSLLQRAHAALAGESFDLILSPVLPAAWPPQGPAVEFFAYASMPLPSGVVSYRITGPKFRLILPLPEGKPVLTAVEDGKASGTEYDRGLGAEGMGNAQEALLEVVAGRRDPEAAKADLRAYVNWSRHGAVMGADARKRKGAFFAWLEAENPAGAAPRPR